MVQISNLSKSMYRSMVCIPKWSCIPNWPYNLQRPTSSWRLPDGGHFGHKKLRHQDTLGHFGTDLKTLRRQKTWYETLRHECRDRGKSRDTSTQENSDETAPPVIRFKLRHQFCGAEVSCGRSVRLPSWHNSGSVVLSASPVICRGQTDQGNRRTENILHWRLCTSTTATTTTPTSTPAFQIL